jgi:hypothetical protein
VQYLYWSLNHKSNDQDPIATSLGHWIFIHYYKTFKKTYFFTSEANGRKLYVTQVLLTPVFYWGEDSGILEDDIGISFVPIRDQMGKKIVDSNNIEAWTVMSDKVFISPLSPLLLRYIFALPAAPRGSLFCFSVHTFIRPSDFFIFATKLSSMFIFTIDRLVVKIIAESLSQHYENMLYRPHIVGYG